jgi:hypothetical protein
VVKLAERNRVTGVVTLRARPTMKMTETQLRLALDG